MSKEAEKFYGQSKTANIPEIMQAYADKCVEERQKRIVEVLDSFLKYYESDFFHVSATEQRVYAEWVVKAKELLEKHKHGETTD